MSVDGGGSRGHVFVCLGKHTHIYTYALKHRHTCLSLVLSVEHRHTLLAFTSLPPFLLLFLLLLALVLVGGLLVCVWSLFRWLGMNEGGAIEIYMCM